MQTRGNLSLHRTSARRLVTAMAGLALALAMLPVVAGAVPGSRAVHARADDTTLGLDTNRDSWDSSESTTTMGPSAVKTFSATPRFNIAVSGDVYAQPLVVPVSPGSTTKEVVVATENDQVYAYSPGTNTQLWHVSLGSPFVIGKVSSLSKCTDLTPNIGITGTPAYDAASNELYMFANIVDPGTNTPHYYLVGLNATTGVVAQKIHVSGRPSNNSHIKFQAAQQMERPGVLVMADGSVWGAFASHCDIKPYVGFVTRVIPSTGAFTLWSDESGTTYNQAGIWQGGSGIMQDSQGRVFLASGNGVSPSKGPGSKPPGQLAESVIQLGVNSDGTLKALQFFSPANAPSLDAADTDYGGGGPVGIRFAMGNNSNVLAQAGKDGRIFLLNRDSLGGREQGSGGKDASLFVTKNYGGEWGHPAVFGANDINSGNANTSGDYLVYVGKDDVLRVFRMYITSSGAPGMSNVAVSTLTYGYTSGSPVVTSQGNDPSNAVIWEVFTPNTTGKTGVGSVLEAYQLSDATGSGCTSASMCKLSTIWHSNTFTSAKFSVPATSDGWVYVGTRDGHLLEFAAPGTAAPAVSTTASFATTAVGATTTKDVSVTAQQPVTVTGPPTATGGVSNGTATNQFTAGQVTLTHGATTTPVTSYPVTLAKGDKLTTQVAFKPSSPGGNDGTLSVPTSSATSPTVSVPLTGDATQAGLYPQPGTIQFMGAPDQHVVDVAVGITVPQTVTITNFGTTTETVTSVTPPAAPFTATNLPLVGQQIKPGNTVTVQVNFAPTVAGPITGTLTIAGSSGPPATVTLNGTGTAAVSQFTPVNPVVNFGTVPVGKKAKATVFITNSGNTESTIQGAAPVTGPFAATLSPNPQMPFNASSDLAIPVTFTPKQKGSFSTQYKLTWKDVNGTHTVSVTLTGKAV
jgi:HYDIN/CFA65/VesB-like, Ig-like domain/Abnormal spindle-like microcephaly-assoc'd, ASPM-SPD-2-Hydin